MKKTRQITPKHRIEELDVFRGLAALMVVTFHLSMYFSSTVGPGRFFKFGITGVDLFFIISGFVIPLSTDHVKSGKEFIINRFTRLYPVYWICLTLSFLLQVWDVHCRLHNPVPRPLYIEYGVNFSMFQYYFKIKDMEPPYWSLIIELLFYIVVFVIYKLKRLHRIETILFTIVILQSALITAGILLPNNEGVKQAITAELLFPLLHYLSLFTIGVVFYKIRTQKIMAFRVLVLVICYVEEVMEYSNRPGLTIFSILQWEYAITLAIFILLFFLFVYGRLSFIVNKISLFFGRISYPLYLFHQFLLLNVLVPFFQNSMHLSYLVSSIFSVLIAVSIASFITLKLDEPIRYRLRKLLKQQVD